MRPPERTGFLRDRSLAILFPALLAALFCAAAQAQEVAYSVSVAKGDKPWPTRPDGKLPALSFSFATQDPVTVPASGKMDTPTREGVLQIPAGDTVVAWWRLALVGGFVDSLLIEFPSPSQKAGQRAPLALRLHKVFVASVRVSRAKGDAGPGIAEVRVVPAGLEVYGSVQEATGAMKPGQQFNWDFAKRQMLSPGAAPGM